MWPRSLGLGPSHCYKKNIRSGDSLFITVRRAKAKLSDRGHGGLWYKCGPNLTSYFDDSSCSTISGIFTDATLPVHPNNTRFFSKAISPPRLFCDTISVWRYQFQLGLTGLPLERGRWKYRCNGFCLTAAGNPFLWGESQEAEWRHCLANHLFF